MGIVIAKYLQNKQLYKSRSCSLVPDLPVFDTETMGLFEINVGTANNKNLRFGTPGIQEFGDVKHHAFAGK